MTMFSYLIFSLLLGPANADSHLRLKAIPSGRATNYRGAVLGQGRLQNLASQKCLDVEGTSGKGNVLTWECLTGDDQDFILYENGELVNVKSRLCVTGHGGNGNIDMQGCYTSRNDQKWKVYAGHDGHFFLKSEKTDKCLDVWGNSGDGNVGSWDCVHNEKQAWSWIASDSSAAHIVDNQ